MKLWKVRLTQGISSFALTKTLIEGERAVCPAVHFVTALGTQLLVRGLDLTKAKQLRQMIRAILFYGTGVGGISTRQANGAEGQAMVDVIFCVTVSDPSPSAFSARTPHQQAVQSLVQQGRELLATYAAAPASYKDYIGSLGFNSWSTRQEQIDSRLIQALIETHKKQWCFLTNHIPKKVGYDFNQLARLENRS